MTTIYSNGSKWAGQEPDSLETLLEVMEHHPISADVSNCECDINDRAVQFLGNFDTVSHVFNIDATGDDIARLREAIAKNREKFPPPKCTHNRMVPNDEPGFAWMCADCGYVYGKAEGRD